MCNKNFKITHLKHINFFIQNTYHRNKDLPITFNENSFYFCYLQEFKVVAAMPEAKCLRYIYWEISRKIVKIYLSSITKKAIKEAILRKTQINCYINLIACR